jgi:hypothetical protein
MEVGSIQVARAVMVSCVVVMIEGSSAHISTSRSQNLVTPQSALVAVPGGELEGDGRVAAAADPAMSSVGRENDLAAGGYIAEQFQQAADGSQDNLLGDLAAACAFHHLDAMTVQVIMITLFSAGGESTSSLIGSAAWILATHSHSPRRNEVRNNASDSVPWLLTQASPG